MLLGAIKQDGQKCLSLFVKGPQMGLKEKPPQEGEGLREVHRSTCSKVWHLSGARSHATDRHFWGNPKSIVVKVMD